MKRLSSMYIITLIIMLIFAGTINHQAKANPPDVLEVKVAVQQILPTLGFHVALQQGFFEKHGLNVQPTLVRGGPLVNNAVQGDEVHMGAMNYDAVINTRGQGFDYKLVYPAGIYDSAHADAYLVVGSRTGIKEAKDFVGRKVAVAFGEISEFAVRAYLVNNGVDPDDVEFVDMPFPAMVSALASGSIDAAHLPDPFLSTVVNEGFAVIHIPDLDVVGNRFLIHTWFAKADWVEQNGEVIRRFAAALKEATEFIMSDLERATPLAARALGLDMELFTQIFPKRWIGATTITVEELQRPIDFNYEWGGIDRPMSYEELLSPYFPLSD